jgi:hypothetical protein
LHHPLKKDVVFEVNMNSKVCFEVLQLRRLINTRFLARLMEQGAEAPLVSLHSRNQVADRDGRVWGQGPARIRGFFAFPDRGKQHFLLQVQISIQRFLENAKSGLCDRRLRHPASESGQLQPQTIVILENDVANQLVQWRY